MRRVADVETCWRGTEDHCRTTHDGPGRQHAPGQDLSAQAAPDPGEDDRACASPRARAADDDGRT